MNKKISIIDGIQYLIDIADNSINRISDYIEIENSPVIIIGLIIKEKEYYDGGKTHVKSKKKWGCISNNGKIIIPFIYDNMRLEFNFIEATIEYDNNPCLPSYKSFYFDNQGVPICSNNRKRFYEWEWVENFDKHKISVGQKNGKQGILREDGSIFLPPQYLSVNIDHNKPLITAICEDKKTIQWIYRREIKKWFQLPKSHRFVYFSDNLYIIENNRIQYAMDTAWQIVIPPYFDAIKVYKDYCIVSKDGLKGLLSRKRFITIKELKSPIYAPLLYLEFNDRKKGNNKLIIIIKDSKQGVYNIEKDTILLNPCISTNYQIIPETLTNEAIAYKKHNEYGYFDLYGNLLFKINIENDYISKVHGFKNGKAIVLGRKYYYIFDKKGTFEKRIIKQQLYNRIWHNYEAESWDAMTDGMSGDFPGNEVDYDLLGF